MILKFINDYLSIRKFNEASINNFSILTGQNGSGKTHLLHAIKKGNVRIDNIDIQEIIYFSNKDFYVSSDNRPQSKEKLNLLSTQKNNLAVLHNQRLRNVLGKIAATTILEKALLRFAFIPFKKFVTSDDLKLFNEIKNQLFSFVGNYFLCHNTRRGCAIGPPPN